MNGARGFELVAVALLLLALMGAAVLAADAESLFVRSLWTDEYFTSLIAGAPSLRIGLAALADGVDSHPPTYYVLLRATAGIVGDMTPLFLRGFSFAATWLAFVGVFVLLRRSFDVLPSAAAVACLAAHGLVLQNAFEARQYAPWMMAAIWFCWSLPTRFEADGSRFRMGALALTSILLCTLHYFGIVSFLLILIGDFALCHTQYSSHPGDHRYTDWLRTRVPAVAGPFALIACAPILIGQKAAYSVPTWIAPLTLERGIKDGQTLFGPLIWTVGVLLGAMLICEIVRRSRGRATSLDIDRLRQQVPLLMLMAFPVVLVVFSYLLQPAYKARYATPTMLALTPVAAWLATRVPKFLVYLFCISAFWLTVQALDLAARFQNIQHLARVAQVQDLEQLPGDAPVAFELIHDIVPLCHLRGECDKRWFLYPIASEPKGWQVSPLVLTADVAVPIEKYFGEPRRIDHSTLLGNRVFYFMSWPMFNPRALRARFPGFEVEQLKGRLSRLQREGHGD